MIKIKVITLFLMLFSDVCSAYIGPGAGVSTVGTAVIFLLVVFFLFLGFLWYPIKSLFKKEEKKVEDSESDSAGKL